MAVLTKERLKKILEDPEEIDLDDRVTQQTGIELDYKMKIDGKKVSFDYELDFSEIADVLRKIAIAQYDVDLDGKDDDIYNMFIGLGVNIDDDIIWQNKDLVRELIKDNVQLYVEEAYQDYLDNEAVLKKYEEEE